MHLSFCGPALRAAEEAVLEKHVPVPAHTGAHSASWPCPVSSMPAGAALVQQDCETRASVRHMLSVLKPISYCGPGRLPGRPAGGGAGPALRPGLREEHVRHRLLRVAAHGAAACAVRARAADHRRAPAGRGSGAAICAGGAACPTLNRNPSRSAGLRQTDPSQSRGCCGWRLRAVLAGAAHAYHAVCARPAAARGRASCRRKHGRSRQGRARSRARPRVLAAGSGDTGAPAAAQRARPWGPVTGTAAPVGQARARARAGRNRDGRRGGVLAARRPGPHRRRGRARAACAQRRRHRRRAQAARPAIAKSSCALESRPVVPEGKPASPAMMHGSGRRAACASQRFESSRAWPLVQVRNTHDLRARVLQQGARMPAGACCMHCAARRRLVARASAQQRRAAARARS